MKRFCVNCGEELWGSHRKYCSVECTRKFRTSGELNTIANNFALFKNIVSASETAQEFREYWREYFRSKGGGK